MQRMLRDYKTASMHPRNRGIKKVGWKEEYFV